MKASIIIDNYNNAKFIEECVNSLNSQTYKNIEIIFFDDNSKDDSIKIIEKFQNIKIIKNDVQTKFGSLNQMNAFKKGVEVSTGDIIFFLDSDDFFHKTKVEKVINLYANDNNKMIIYDLPIILRNEKKIYQKKNKLLKSYWGYIHPTSCISIRKKIINKVFEATLNNDYTDVWFDLRVLLFSKYLNSYEIINEHLTYYRQTDENISSKFKKFSKNWWRRRNEAHDYFFEFLKKNNLKTERNLDFYITKIINKFIS